MILRRLVESFRRQDWFTVFIETMIVLFGVFLGLQASNWNDERQMRHDAADFHQRLLADMRLEAQQYRFLQHYYRSVRNAAAAAYADLAGKEELGDAAFLVNAFRASQFTWAERHRATFDELVASGNLDLIDDVQLRTAVTGYYAMELLDEVSRESQTSEYRRAFRKILPPDIHEALHNQCGDRQIDGAPAGLVTLEYACAFEWPEEEIAAAAGALRSNDELPSLLRLRISDLAARDYSLEQNFDGYALSDFYPEGSE